jgi:hypothetical protein
VVEEYWHKSIVKIHTFDNVFLRDTFELDYAVGSKFSKTQPIHTVQTDEKHNQKSLKVYQKTSVFLTNKILLADYEKKIIFSSG